MLPFAVTAEVTSQLNSFKAGECNWVELTVVDEVVNLVGYRTVSSTEPLQSFIDPEAARYTVLLTTVST